MGIGASSSVKEIRISQSEPQQRLHERRPTRGSMGNLRDRAASLSEKLKPIRSASADAQISRLKNALDSVEKRKTDAETRVRSLEKELSTIELRNMELNHEVSWLKQQLMENPEVPVPPRRLGASRESPSLDDGSTKSSVDAESLARLQQQIHSYEQEITFTKVAFHDEKAKLQDELIKIKKNSQCKIERLESELRSVTQYAQKYDEMLRSSKTPVIESTTSTPRRRTVPELQAEIEVQQNRIRLLESLAQNRDSEFGKLKDSLGKDPSSLSESLKIRRSAFKRAMKSKQFSKADVDNILDGPAYEKFTKSVDNSSSPVASSLEEDSTSPVPPYIFEASCIKTADIKDHHEVKESIESFNPSKLTPLIPVRSSSRSTKTPEATSSLKAASRPGTGSRPVTRDGLKSRTSSAPMLFKARSGSRSGKEELLATENDNSDFTEIMSLAGEEEYKGGPVAAEPNLAAITEDGARILSKPPRPHSRSRKSRRRSERRSRTSYSEAESGGDSSEDDEIKRLFVGMQGQGQSISAPEKSIPIGDPSDSAPSNQAVQNHTCANRGVGASRHGSAKSHDSGYLGESATSLALNLERTLANKTTGERNETPRNGAAREVVTDS